MVTHYKVGGHLACGHKGSKLTSSTELTRVKCRSCRNTDAFKEARRNERNAARRAARKAKVTHTANDWRAAWVQRLTAMPDCKDCLVDLPVNHSFSGQLRWLNRVRSAQPLTACFLATACA